VPPEPSPALQRVRTYTFEKDGLERLRRLLGQATVVVDGLLGTGRARPIEGDLAAILDAVRDTSGDRTLVALDLPSGLNADTGALDSHTVPADVTLTFGFPKRGLLLEPGAAACGRVVVVDIGLPDRLAGDVSVVRPRRKDVAALIPQRERQANKYSAGAVLVVAGSPPFPGAPRLAALGAARVGAGLVTVATGCSAHPLVVSTLLEMTFVLLPDDGGALRAAPALAALHDRLSRYRCVVIGPGLGQDPGTQDTIYALLTWLKGMPDGERPHVLVDADGLNALAARERFWALLPPQTVLTPHAGEMGRLREAAGHAGGSRAVEADRLEVARASASQWQAIIVLKGAHTIVAAPDGRVSINTTGGPNLATAGSGDVLGGIIAGLAAQGAAPFEAALGGVYLHGSAGDRLARRWGDRGTLASDLLRVLPRTLRAVLRDGQPTIAHTEEDKHEG
jgi:NAD(P)H-hydrate epimerase